MVHTTNPRSPASDAAVSALEKKFSPLYGAPLSLENVFRSAAKKVDGLVEIDEIINESYIALFEALERFCARTGDAQSFVCGVVYRVAKQLGEREVRERHGGRKPVSKHDATPADIQPVRKIHPFEQIALDAENGRLALPDEKMETEQDLAVVRSVIAEFEPRNREIYEGLFRDGLPQAQMARRFKTTQPRVSQLRSQMIKAARLRYYAVAA